MQSTEPTPPTIPGLSIERAIFLVGAVQFVNVLDFMMVMPMGPDFALALDIETSRIGYIGGSYTAAAAVSGAIGAFFLDRFDRRKALALAMLGLSLGTAAGALATGLSSLLVARVIAGAFGGPATSLAVSVIADIVPPEKRGVAMGKVMGAFSIASVLGVPVGLELARLGSFRTPFLAVAGLGLVITIAVIAALPPLVSHLAAAQAEPEERAPFDLASVFEPAIMLMLLATTCVMIGNFLLIPNLSAFFQYNRGYPRESMGMLYLFGGAVSFFVMRLTGRAVDRFGSTQVLTAGSAIYAVVVTAVFMIPGLFIPTLLAFVLFMTSNAMRFVPIQALSSRVPLARNRARFLSVQSSVQHVASSIGAVLSSVALTTGEGGRLIGMPRVAGLTLGLSVAVPILCMLVERRVRTREAGESPSFAPAITVDATHT